MVGRFMGRMGDVSSILQTIAQAAAKYGLDAGFVTAVARAESGLNPNAVSPKGAKGIMQLTDATAATLGVTNVFDATQNIYAGAKYLAQLLSQYAGDTVKALAAYNWGPGNLSAALKQWGSDWLAHAPAETQAYVQALTGITPSSNAPAQSTPASDTSAPLTIDAATGAVIDDTTPTPVESSLPSWMPQTPQGQLALLTGFGIAAYLIAREVLGE
jgi:soluble lytic murein transglycosylase-like protein